MRQATAGEALCAARFSGRRIYARLRAFPAQPVLGPALRDCPVFKLLFLRWLAWQPHCFSRWWCGAVNDEKVMHKHRQPNLPLCATSATTGELTHRTMLLEVGKPQFHRLTTESVEALGFRRGHPHAVGLDQCLMFATFDGSAAVRIGAARDLPRDTPDNVAANNDNYAPR